MAAQMIITWIANMIHVYLINVSIWVLCYIDNEHLNTYNIYANT